jgi:hypothetical protein
MNKEYELKTKDKEGKTRDLNKKKRKTLLSEGFLDVKNNQREKIQYFQLVLGNKMERVEIKEYFILICLIKN